MLRADHPSRLDQTRELNRHRVLAELRQSGSASRTEISRRTGLSAATVSAIVADFFEEGLVCASTPETSGRGRPTISLSFNPDAALICSVYLQFRSVGAAVFDYSGNTLAEIDLPLTGRSLNRQAIRKALIGCIRKVLALADTGSPLSRIAVGFQGVTSVDSTQVLWSPITEERDLPIAEWLTEAFVVPASVSNDCNMMVRALNWKDPQSFGESFGAILLAHGVGMGLFLSGSIVNGTQSSGIEFGHVNHIPDGALCRCGNRGCIEAYAGDYAIARAASGEPGDAPPLKLLQPSDLSGIHDRALNGDQAAKAAIASAGRAIGSGIASLYALVDEFPIVLIGQGASLFDLMEKSIRETLATAPGARSNDPVDISCYLDDGALVREGCALTALLEKDVAFATRKNIREAVA